MMNQKESQWEAWAMIQLLIEAVSKERLNDVQRGEDVEQISF